MLHTRIITHIERALPNYRKSRSRNSPANMGKVMIVWVDTVDEATEELFAMHKAGVFGNGFDFVEARLHRMPWPCPYGTEMPAPFRIIRPEPDTKTTEPVRTIRTGRAMVEPAKRTPKTRGSLLASSGTLQGILQCIAKFYFSDTIAHRIGESGEVIRLRDEKNMGNVRVVVKGRRYRFEMY